MAEIEAIRAFNGRGMVGLLESDLQEGAMLLERLVPGGRCIRCETIERR